MTRCIILVCCFLTFSPLPGGHALIRMGMLPPAVLVPIKYFPNGTIAPQDLVYSDNYTLVGTKLIARKVWNEKCEKPNEAGYEPTSYRAFRTCMMNGYAIGKFDPQKDAGDSIDMCKAQELLEAMKKLLGENYYNIILVMMDCVNNWMQEDKAVPYQMPGPFQYDDEDPQGLKDSLADKLVKFNPIPLKGPHGKEAGPAKSAGVLEGEEPVLMEDKTKESAPIDGKNDEEEAEIEYEETEEGDISGAAKTETATMAAGDIAATAVTGDYALESESEVTSVGVGAESIALTAAAGDSAVTAVSAVAAGVSAATAAETATTAGVSAVAPGVEVAAVAAGATPVAASAPAAAAAPSVAKNTSRKRRKQRRQ